MKKIFIHFGPPKTGTTALQKNFYTNSLLMKKKGVSYLNDFAHSESLTVFANGIPLRIALVLNDFEKCVTIINELFSGCNTAIVSDEGLIYLEKDSLNVLKNALGFLKVDANFVGYDREKEDHSKSIYKQLVRDGSKLTYFEFKSNNYLFDIYDRFKREVEILFGSSSIVMLDYKKSYLAENFYKAAIPDLDTSNFSYDNCHVNESLSNIQVNIVRDFNEVISKRYGIQNEISKRYANSLSNELLSKIDHLNLDIMNDSSDVEISMSSEELKCKSNRECIDYKNAFNWILNFLTCDRVPDVIENYIHQISRQINISILDDKSIPEEFNPWAYLFLNPDLVDGLLNPYEHYLEHGRFENRAIKF